MQQRAAFVELKDHLCSSPTKRVVMMDPEWSDPKVPDTEKEILYSLFRRTGTKGVYYDADCSFRLAVWSSGWVGGGDYKGFSYRPIEHWLGKEVDVPLESIKIEDRAIAFFSYPIGDGWNLYFQHWP